MPTVNAALNVTSAVLLIVGVLSIRAKQIPRHAAFMVGALSASALFFISYLTYHAQAGSVRFQGTGWVRPTYFTILITHTILAVVIVPLALRTLFLAIKQRVPEHAALARWTFPLWLYVCVSGVVVYWMLYQWK